MFHPLHWFFKGLMSSEAAIGPGWERLTTTPSQLLWVMVYPNAQLPKAGSQELIPIRTTPRIPAPFYFRRSSEILPLPMFTAHLS